MVTMNGEEPTAIMPAAAPTIDHSLDDDDDDAMSDDSSHNYDDSSDLMSATMEDEVTAQLAAAGPVGMAAAAAIASAKKRKRPHTFETNPSIRKRQQTRLLRKLRQTIDEFTIRVGMQAVVLVAIPGKPQNSFKCFGAKPLEDVIRTLRPVVMQDLESALAAHTPAPAPEDPSLHELPPLVIDGIPTPVEKMTQAQLRAFIPLMLKYSTGRGKPGWGKESTRPPWWPQDLPWANVRMDARTEDEKQKVSWTHALRQIVINCYKFHGREDLLPVFSGEPDDVETKPPVAKIAKASISTINTNTTTVVATSSQSQNQSIATQALPSEKMFQLCEFLKPGNQEKFGVYGNQIAQLAPTVFQTITNADGTMSIIQMDPTNSIITLPDGTTAQVQGVATLQHSSDGTPTVQTVQTLGDGSEMPVTVDLNSVTQAALSQDGQIILTGEDGHAYPVTVSGMITVPVPQNMYQTVVANISQLQAQQNPDGTLQSKVNKASQKAPMRSVRTPKTPIIYSVDSDVVTPMVLPKVESNSDSDGNTQHTTAIPVSALTGDPNNTQLVAVNANGQVVHNDKIYQLCEFVKPESQEKVIMMTPIGNQSADGDGDHSSGQVQVVETRTITTSSNINGNSTSNGGSREIQAQKSSATREQSNSSES